MTGGRVVVLGPTGRNFAAGMSGGIAYVHDPDGTFASRCNMGLVGFDEIDEADAAELHMLVGEHFQRTASPVAERVLGAAGFEVLTAHGGVDALRRVSHLPVDVVLLSASAPPTQLGIFLAAFAELPRARPVPIVLAGASRPYRESELLGAVRSTLSLPEERLSPLERLPREALMVP